MRCASAEFVEIDTADIILGKATIDEMGQIPDRLVDVSSGETRRRPN